MVLRVGRGRRDARRSRDDQGQCRQSAAAPATGTALRERPDL